MFLAVTELALEPSEGVKTYRNRKLLLELHIDVATFARHPDSLSACAFFSKGLCLFCAAFLSCLHELPGYLSEVLTFAG